mmetsp:Transcript_18132/g.36512  ORF Transcript_18132/g.36512 Transcript_18132/m.36512 type:complete len:360 (+) Transcript_18132:90-1169(+)
MFLNPHVRASVFRLARSSAAAGFPPHPPSSSSAAATCAARDSTRTSRVIPNAIPRRTFASLTSLIKELRTQTGAPMVECKKALSDPDVDGDLAKAAEWLRKHGSAKAASKLTGREASEGLVGLLTSRDGTSASIVRVASETDFASRSDAFGKLVEDVANAALSLDTDGEIDVEADLLPASTRSNAATVKDALDEAILAIRENLQISEANRVTAAAGSETVLADYVHGKIPGSTCAGTSAALVEIVKTDDNSKTTQDEMKEVGKKLAMHVVAAKPTYLSPDEVPSDVLDKEKAILMEQMADSGKPADILEKIVTGRLRKFYEGVCLTDQPHMVEEGNPKVSKTLAEKGLEVKSFQYKSIQ